MDPDARSTPKSSGTTTSTTPPAATYSMPVDAFPPQNYANIAYTVPEIPNGLVANRRVFGGTPIGGPEPGASLSSGSVVKFKLTLPDNSLRLRPEYRQLFNAYSDLGTNGFHDGTSFILYSLLKDVSESVEHAVSMKRSKGGYVESHWGTRPSVIQASGQIGLFLSSVGLTPFQVEDPDGHSETVLYWDPTVTTIMLEQGTPLANNSNAFNNGLEKLVNTGVNKIGDLVQGTLGNLLSTANATGYTGRNPGPSLLPTANPTQAASVGTNLAFRNFRLVLDLFKHNGLVLDSIPNIWLYPATFTASERYAKADGTLGIRPSLADSTTEDIHNPATFFNMRKNSMIAPANVLAVLPVEMYIKNTKYTGFFQNFNYSFSEDEPFTGFYDFTFIAKTTERTAVFFNAGTSGGKPFSRIGE